MSSWLLRALVIQAVGIVCLGKVFELDGNATLECQHGEPAVQMATWQKDGSGLANLPCAGCSPNFAAPCSKGACAIMTPKCDLWMGNVGFDHEGQYQCIVNDIYYSTYDVSTKVSPAEFTMNGVPGGWVELTEKYTLFCDVPRVKPEGEIVWVVNGEEVPTTSTSSPSDGEPTHHLTGSHDLTVTGTEDVSLVCRVRHLEASGGGIWKDKEYKTVEVYYPPNKATMTVDNRTPDDGESVTFTCSATGGKPSTISSYFWYHKGQKQAETSDPTWRLGPLDYASDDGMYSCAGANEAGPGHQSDGTDIEVGLPPQNITLSNDGKDWVEAATEVTFNCYVSAIKPKDDISWQIAGAPQTGLDTVATGNGDTSFHLTSTMTESFPADKELEEETVNIQCSVPDRSGEKSDDKDYSIYYRPTTTVENATENRPPLEGTSYTLRCNVKDARPRHITKYEWKRDGTTLPRETGETLTIASLDKDVDGGEYSCAAQNVPGMGQHGETLTVTVWYAPTVSVTGPNPPAIEGSPAEIVCELEDGYPKSLHNVTWDRNDEELNIADASHICGGTIFSPGLSFSPAMITDDALYTCHLTTAAGSGSSAPVHLIVQYPPKVDLSQYSMKAASLDRATVIETFTSAEPSERSYEWSFHGETLRPGIEGTKTAIITIQQVQMDDYGDYTCRVCNVINGAKYCTEVKVQLRPMSAPQAPKDPLVEPVSSQRINVSWTTGFNGGTEQTFTVELRREEDTNFTTVATGIADPSNSNAPVVVTYSVGNLQPRTRYRFRIMASNENEDGETESDWLETGGVDTKDKPVIEITKLKTGYGDPTAVEVEYLLTEGEPDQVDLLFVEGDVSGGDAAEWQLLLPHLPVDQTTHTAVAVRNLESHVTYSFCIQPTEGSSDVSVPGDGGIWVQTGKEAPACPETSCGAGLHMVSVVAWTLAAASYCCI